MYSNFKIDVEKYGIEGIKMIFCQGNLLIMKRLGKFVKQCYTIRKLETKRMEEESTKDKKNTTNEIT